MAEARPPITVPVGLVALAVPRAAERVVPCSAGELAAVGTLSPSPLEGAFGDVAPPAELVAGAELPVSAGSSEVEDVWPLPPDTVPDRDPGAVVVLEAVDPELVTWNGVAGAKEPSVFMPTMT